MKRPQLIPILILTGAMLFGGCGSNRTIPMDNYPEWPDRKSKKEAKQKNTQKPKKQSQSPPDIHGTRADVVDEARRWLGTPYRYGGESRSGTDCSGMTMVIFRDVAGVKIPRDSRTQQQWCKSIPRKDLKIADLVFFASRAGGDRVGHVGIYIGNGDFIHASTSKGVIVSNLEEDYYSRHFHSAGRIFDDAAASVPVSADTIRSRVSDAFNF